MRLRPILTALCAGMLVACQAAQPGAAGAAVDHRVVHASATCGTADASVRRIADSRRLKEVLGDDAEALEPGPEGVLMLRLSMGEQPSAGATFEIASLRTGPAPDRLQVVMRWAPPDASRMNASVITRPCLIVRVSGGPYREVQMLDGDARVRASAALHGPR